MKYISIILILWTLFCHCISCDSKKNLQKNSIENRVTIDTNAVLILEEPKYISRDSSMNLIIKLLGLNKIKDHSNNEEIRIWYNDRSVTGKIIVIKNTSGKWYSAGYIYKANFDAGDNIVSLEKKKKENLPTSGWDIFLNNLNDLRFLKLVNNDKIPNYYSCNDGDHIAIEIWKDGEYYIYDYPCFSLYADELKEVIRIKEICLLIEKEFGYELIP